MKIIDPHEFVVVKRKRGLSDEEFQELLADGRSEVTFLRTEGCIKINSTTLTRRIPEALRSDENDLTTYSDKYTYFVTSEVDLYLIIGKKIHDNGQVASWQALSSDEIFTICEDLGIENCYAADRLYEKIEEYKAFMSELMGL